MTIRRFVQAALVIGVAFFMAASASAAPLCTASTLLSQLIALGAGGCQNSDGTLLFNNFSYTPQGSDPAANLITYSPVNNTILKEYGFAFDPSTGAWSSGFNLSFTVAVTAGNPQIAIIGSVDQENSGFTPNGTSVVDTQTGGTLTVTGTSTSTETTQLGPYILETVTSSSVGTVPAGAAISSWEQDFFEGSSAPEPATFSLIGGALLGLGIMLRRKTT